MPRPNQISTQPTERVSLPSLPWLNDALGGGFVRGGIYLLAGEPGIGKTTLVLQVLGDLAANGTRALYVTTEQGLPDVNSALLRIHAGPEGKLPTGIESNFFMDDSVEDLTLLPQFLAKRVLTSGGEYAGVQVIAFDSIQGRGLPAAASSKYRALYDFTAQAKAAGLVSILIGHITKKGQIAGPKDLEHNVDCILYLRRAFSLRPLFIPKNRFAPAVLEPLVTVMDNRGRLTKSKLSAAKAASVIGYSGVGVELAEGQATVSLPKYGSRSGLNAPSLPQKKIKQIIDVISSLKDVDIADLSYQINCYLPRKQTYREELDLPIAVALLSSYLQQPVDPRRLFVGELDLTGRIRPPERRYLAALAQLLTSEPPPPVDSVVISEGAATDLAEMRPSASRPKVAKITEVIPISDLPTLIGRLWPQLVGF